MGGDSLMLKVGLTGAVASGKSTAARVLAQEGIPVLDADRVVHDLYERDPGTIEEVLRAFPEASDGGGGIDRAALGRTAFAGGGNLRRLEDIVHPRVMEYISSWFARQKHAPAAVVEAALWHRLDARRGLDILVTVLADEAVRRRRLRKRGLPPDQVEARLHAQGPMPAQDDARHWVVINEGPLSRFEDDIRNLAARLRQRAREEGETRTRDGNTRD